MRTIPRSQANVAGFAATLGLVFALTAALMGGGGIPVQAKAGQDLAIQYLGDSYAAFALSTATSIFGSGSFFAFLTIVCWVLAVLFGINAHPHFGSLLYGEKARWTFYVSGTPGALYMTVYQVSIDYVGLVLAMIAGMCGIISFPVARAYLKLWLKEKLPQRSILRQLRRRIGGVCCLLLATASMGVVNTGAKILSGMTPTSAFLTSMAMITFGAGIAWQFSVLADMQKVIAEAQEEKGPLSTVASVASASLMSSISGCLTALASVPILVYGLRQRVSYTWPRVDELRDLWYYCNIISGVCIIGLGTFASKHVRVGKDRQIFLMASGSLAVSLVISVFTTPFSWGVLTLQVVVCLLGVCGIYLCTITPPPKEKKRPTQPLDLAA